ncbi:MAG TPA: MurR/RpiR family transcriptional regulator [Candidatus Cybelea sp.]|nr:MurR/RpiR family transcriptional regulator [Candidatus Cybelea sp.]
MRSQKTDIRRSDREHDGLDARLRAGWLDFARAEQAIARYLLDNMEEVPFETGATIAAAAGVSEASVARFARRLGFSDLKHLKRDLRRQSRADLDNAASRFRIGDPNQERLTRSLQMEQDALAAAYGLAHGKLWDQIIALLAERERVNCVGFQAVKGLALDFSTRMRWVRGGVHFAEGLGGTYSEILTEDPRRSCVVMVDTAEYAAMTFRLAAEIRQRQIPLIVVTDKYSHWAADFTNLALEVSTRVDLYWDSTAAISAVLTLLTHAVAEKLGHKAEKRMDELELIAGKLQTFRKMPKRLWPQKGERNR